LERLERSVGMERVEADTKEGARMEWAGIERHEERS
jgi:hypothetical protein